MDITVKDKYIPDGSLAGKWNQNFLLVAGVIGAVVFTRLRQETLEAKHGDLQNCSQVLYIEI
jgi:hypothetical protein